MISTPKEIASAWQPPPQACSEFSHRRFCLQIRKAHLYGACIPDGMIVSQLCAVDGFYCNFCWRLIRSSSVILNGLEGIVKEQPTVDLHLFFAIEAAFTGAICAHCSYGWALHQRCTQSLDVMASAGT